MKQKRFKKLCMAKGISRNEVQSEIDEFKRSNRITNYQESYDFLLEKEQKKQI